MRYAAMMRDTRNADIGLFTQSSMLGRTIHCPVRPDFNGNDRNYSVVGSDSSAARRF